MADNETKDLLNAWDYQKSINIFVAQEIGKEALLELTNDILKDIIINAGPRVLFLRKLTIYKDRLKNNIMNMVVDIPGANIINSDSDTMSNISQSSTITNNSMINIETCVAFDDILMHQQNDEPSTSDLVLKRKPMYSTLLPFEGEKQMKQMCRPVYHFDLKQCLTESTIGNFILSIYESDKILNKKARNCLVQLLINEMF